MAKEHERLPVDQVMREATEALRLALEEKDPAKQKELLRLTQQLIGDGLDMSQADLDEWRRQHRAITEPDASEGEKSK